MQEKPGGLGAGLRGRLEWFVFFHLGADAQLEVREEGSSITVSISHRRVQSVEFTVGRLEIERWLAEPAELERFLLEQLTRHRR